MQNGIEMLTSMSTSCYLDKDEGDKFIKDSKCRSIYDYSLSLYIITRYFDIMFFVCMCAFL